jgi:hypothetical protein
MTPRDWVVLFRRFETTQSSRRAGTNYLATRCHITLVLIAQEPLHYKLGYTFLDNHCHSVNGQSLAIAICFHTLCMHSALNAFLLCHSQTTALPFKIFSVVR